MLFDPLQLRSITLKNRIAVSPMCQYSSEDGFANDWHVSHLGSMAIGGSAMVLTEATAVSPEGRISPQDLGIWKDEHISELKRITDFIKSQGAVPGVQLAHAGRKASTYRLWDTRRGYIEPSEGGWTVFGPSAIAFADTYGRPKEMSIDDIHRVQLDFRRAAERSLAAGFQTVEVHAAHGYLMHQFLSPLSNQRTDEYGGSLENRMRFVLETITQIREVWPDDLPVLMRISATDYTEGGWDLDQSIELSKLAKDLGVDLIDCSSGGNVPAAQIPVGPGYQTQFSEAIKKAGAATGAVGMITEAQQAEDIISSGQADIVLLARALLRDPHWPLRAAKTLGVDVEWPKQYERARD
ncbi:NADH:flavin oxidoreductase/NADH oxidase [soil metagenome]